MTVRPEVAELLRRCVIARVCTVDPDGSPRAAPFWMSFDGERIYLDTLDNITTRNLRRDPRVAVLVDEGCTFADLRGTLVRGVARLWGEQDAPEQVRAGIEALRTAHAAEVETPLFDDYIARETRDVVLVAIEPMHASHWDLAASARGDNGRIG